MIFIYNSYHAHLITMKWHSNILFNFKICKFLGYMYLFLKLPNVCKHIISKIWYIICIVLYLISACHQKQHKWWTIKFLEQKEPCWGWLSVAVCLSKYSPHYAIIHHIQSGDPLHINLDQYQPTITITVTAKLLYTF